MPYKDIEKQKAYQKEYYKNYYKTEKGKKISKIASWKYQGIISENFDELYEKYINSECCELCNVKLTTDKKNTITTRCLDHCHQTGKFRNIVCHSCNCKLR